MSGIVGNTLRLPLEGAPSDAELLLVTLHCPVEQPCPEHDGTGCSLSAGKTIEKEADVDEAVTRAAEAAIAKLESDSARVEEIRKKLEGHKAQLEKECADLERQAQAASTRAERQAVVDEWRAIAKRHDTLEAEVQALAKEIDSLGSSYKTAVFNVARAAEIPKLKFTFTLASGGFPLPVYRLWRSAGAGGGGVRGAVVHGGYGAGAGDSDGGSEAGIDEVADLVAEAGAFVLPDSADSDLREERRGGRRRGRLRDAVITGEGTFIFGRLSQ